MRRTISAARICSGLPRPRSTHCLAVLLLGGLLATATPAAAQDAGVSLPMLSWFFDSSVAADRCASPLVWSQRGLDSLRPCRTKPANAFTASGCLDSDDPSVPKRQLCAEFEQRLRGIAQDGSGETLKKAIGFTAGLIVTTGQTVVAMADLAGNYAIGGTQAIVDSNIGPDGMSAALMTPAAYGDFHRLAVGTRESPSGMTRAIEAGVSRFAFKDAERVDLGAQPKQGRMTWTYTAELHIEAGKQPEGKRRVTMAGHFDPAYVGDINIAGIVVDSYRESPAQ